MLICCAFIVAILACILIRLNWRELESGQRVYACAFAVFYTLSWIYVPFLIPTTGAVVHAFAWQQVEYPDKYTQSILTPEVVARIEKENPLPLSQDWVRNSVMRRASVDLFRFRLYQSALAVLGVVGWFVFPPLIARLLTLTSRRATA